MPPSDGIVPEMSSILKSRLNELTLIVAKMRELGVTEYGDIKLGPIPVEPEPSEEPPKETRPKTLRELRKL